MSIIHKEQPAHSMQIEPSRVVFQLERVGLTDFGSETCFLKFDICSIIHAKHTW